MEALVKRSLYYEVSSYPFGINSPQQAMREHGGIRLDKNPPPPLVVPESDPTVSKAQSHKNTPLTFNSVQKSSNVLVLSPVLRRAPVISSQFLVLETGVEEDGLNFSLLDVTLVQVLEIHPG